MQKSHLYSLLVFITVLSLAVISGCSQNTAPVNTANPAVSTAPSSVPPTVPTTTPAAVTVTGTPDLVITKVWLDGLMINYSIKNIGTASSPVSYTYFYVNDRLPASGSSSFVDILQPGEERSLCFTNYQWEFDKSRNETRARVQSEGYIVLPLDNNKVRVVADATNVVKETAESNNDKVVLVGMLWDYDLLRVSNLAIWKNSNGNLPEAGSENNVAGAHLQIANSNMEETPELETIPQQIPQGWMQGTFGYFYSDENFGSPEVAAIQIPAKLHFISKVGLSRFANGSDGVTFRFGLKDLNDTITWISSKNVTTPGKFEDWNIDLTQYEGQKYYFLLRVDAGASPSNDYAIWNQAKLIQISD